MKKGSGFLIGILLGAVLIMIFAKEKDRKKSALVVWLSVFIILLMYNYSEIKNKLGLKPKESSSYYPVSYATYPRMTGNDVADTIIEREYEKGHPIMMT